MTAQDPDDKPIQPDSAPVRASGPAPDPAPAPATGATPGPGPGPAPISASDQPTTVLTVAPAVPAHLVGPVPAAGFAVSAGPTRAALASDLVTCPECGQLATVDMARREAEDFCRNCDFPLFWAKGTVITPSGEETGASLRRLPGTVGRAATAALMCPHCSEPNSPAADICVRCSRSLHPVDIPEPEPVVVAPPPEPEPEPEPERGFDWWWVVAIVTVLLAVALIVAIVKLG